MADDHPVLVDGRVVSLSEYRERERIARELAEAESDVAMIGAAIELLQLQEAAHEAHWRSRKLQLQTLARSGKGALVYKVRPDALRR